MNGHILAASVALAALAMTTPSYAWNNTNTGNGPNQIVDGGPGAQATARSAAVSGARSSATGGVGYGGAGGVGGQGGRGGRGGTSNVTVNNGAGYDGAGSGGGNGWDGRLPVASAIAPSFGTTNQCGGTAASVGGQFTLFGLSFGGTNMDRICQAQRLGENEIAFEMMCGESREFRDAAYRKGKPCDADRDRFQRETHPPVVEQVSAPAAPFVAAPWCAGATRAQRAANPLSCGR